MSIGSITRTRTLDLRAHDGLVLGALGGALALYYLGSGWWALVGGVIFVALAGLRLDLALLWAVLTIPFYLPTYSNPFPPRQFDGWSFTLVEFAILACFAAWLGRTAPAIVAAAGGFYRGWRVSRYSYPVVFFLLAATVSLATTQYLKVGLREYRTVVLEPLLLYLMLVSTVRDRAGIWRVVQGLVALAVVVSAYSLYHYFGVGEVEFTGGARRVLAIYHSPNALALLLERLAPLAIALGWWTDREGSRLVYLGAGLLALVVLFLTYSRGAWLGLGVAMLLLGALRGRRSFAAVAGCFGIAGSGLLALRLGRTVAEETVFRRLAVWRSALAMGRDHPLTGVGLDNFLYYYRDGGYLRPEGALEPEMSHPHNVVLDWWLRLGVLGLVALAWLQWRFWRTGWGLYRRLEGDPLQGAVAGLLAAMAAGLAHGLIDNSFFLVDLAVLFWISFGLLQRLDWLIKD